MLFAAQKATVTFCEAKYFTRRSRISSDKVGFHPFRKEWISLKTPSAFSVGSLHYIYAIKKTTAWRTCDKAVFCINKCKVLLYLFNNELIIEKAKKYAIIKS
jgi:hypothetical protein